MGFWRARGPVTVGADATLIQDMRVIAPPDRKLLSGEAAGATMQRLPALFTQVAPIPFGPATFSLEASGVQFARFGHPTDLEVRTGFGPHPYSAAKAAVLQLTRTAAVELAEFRIRVNALIPGGVATRIVGHGAGLEDEALDRSIEAVRRSLMKFQPIPRAGEPEDLAHAAAYLASDDSTFVTGQSLGVDGGLTLGKKWPSNYRDEAQAASSRAATH